MPIIQHSRLSLVADIKPVLIANNYELGRLDLRENSVEIKAPEEYAGIMVKIIDPRMKEITVYSMNAPVELALEVAEQLHDIVKLNGKDIDIHVY